MLEVLVCLYVNRLLSVLHHTYLRGAARFCYAENMSRQEGGSKQERWVDPDFYSLVGRLRTEGGERGENLATVLEMWAQGYNGRDVAERYGLTRSGGYVLLEHAFLKLEALRRGEKITARGVGREWQGPPNPFVAEIPSEFGGLERLLGLIEQLGEMPGDEHTWRAYVLIRRVQGATLRDVAGELQTNTIEIARLQREGLCDLEWLDYDGQVYSDLRNAIDRLGGEGELRELLNELRAAGRQGESLISVLEEILRGGSLNATARRLHWDKVKLSRLQRDGLVALVRIKKQKPPFRNEEG